MITAQTTQPRVLEDVEPVEKPNRSLMTRRIPHVKVLVIDDEPLIRWAVAETLGDLGYEVVQAGDRRSAISAIYESAPFEVMLLDLRLPDCDDLSLLAELRSLAPAARIILMTAHGTQEMAERAMALGAFTVVDKPFELTEITALVSRARHASPS